MSPNARSPRLHDEALVKQLCLMGSRETQTMRIDPHVHPTLPTQTADLRAVRRPFVEVLREQQNSPPLKAPANEPNRTPPATASGRETIQKILNQAVVTENQMDMRLKEIASGKVFSPSELLALQAEVFRYSQSVEVVSRVTDKVVGGLKQILSTQV